ncbi:MAG TPA: hypothetical protein VMU36_08870 [Spirochaetia bacterium]|nr:hypothetical protein [Spirochaetia bacterium]
MPEATRPWHEPRPLAIEVVDSARSAQGREFIELPHRLYAGCRQWVPRFRLDMRAILDRKHPFFDRSEAGFFICRRSGRTAGTIAAINNVTYNEHHRSRVGHFYFFDCEDDPAASHALFEAAFTWMRERGLRRVVGPFGFSVMGMGILVEGFEHRAAMTMMNYNYPYYERLLESEGFRKLRDQLSMFLDARAFRLPDKVRRAAEIAMKRGSFEVPEFRTKSALRRYAHDIGNVYNASFQSHGGEYNPLSPREIDQITKDLLTVADPSLIKLLLCKGEIAGFLFGFPDLSEALQRGKGRLNPLSILRLLLEYRRTNWLIVNGAGILPRFQRLGGNALLYFMMERIASRRKFLYVDAVQIAETTELMLADLQTLGAEVFKTHRLYHRDLPEGA